MNYEKIRELALAVGLDDVGCAEADYVEDDARFMEEWIQATGDRQQETGNRRQATGDKIEEGKLHYLAKNGDKRYDPRVLVPGTQTVLVGVLTFEHSGHDYHRTLKSKLYELEAALKNEYGENIVNPDYQHIFCDSAPVLERRWAQKAGLGFIGKNHAFIHPTLGSLVHLGELFLSEKCIPNEIGVSESPKRPCEGCTKCIEACPNHVLGVEPWDVTRCIAYETNHCLICQNCCPFNKVESGEFRV